MREAAHHIRKGIINALDSQITINGSTVPVFNRVPINQSEPFIKVSTSSSDEVDENKTSFTNELIIRIESVTSFLADNGGEYDSNLIVDEILNLVRTRSDSYIDLSSNNFKIYSTKVDSIRYFEDLDAEKTYYRAIIEMAYKVQKTS
jgi:hypothetical protein